MVKLSVVIPTYNMGDHLQRSLRYLSAQHRDIQNAFEVIVVDDGSSDNTEEIARKYNESIEHLNYCYKPRDNTSCRAAARNYGIARSTGEHILFLDSGVIVPPDFVKKQIEFFENYPGDVLIHQVIGLFARPEHEAMPILENASPESLTSAIQELKTYPVWQDERSEIYELVNGDLNRLPAPWALAWTCALAAPRQKIMEIKGFDESFIGWGGEDIDFGFRLFQAGCQFRHVNDTMLTVHWPHPPLEPGAKPQTPKFHKKHNTLETELLSLLDGYHANHFLMRLETLVIHGMKRPVCSEILNAIAGLQQSSGYHLVAGLAEVDIFKRLPHTTDVLCHRRGDTARLQAGLSGSGRRVKRSLGIATDYENQHFDTLVLGDYVGFLPGVLRAVVLEEAFRIARRVFVLVSAEKKRAEKSRLEGVTSSEFLGWRFWSDEELKNTLIAYDRMPESICRGDNGVLYELLSIN